MSSASVYVAASQRGWESAPEDQRWTRKRKAQSVRLGQVLETSSFLAPRPGLEPGTYGLTVTVFAEKVLVLLPLESTSLLPLIALTVNS